MSDVSVTLVDQTPRVDLGEAAQALQLADVRPAVTAHAQSVAVARREEVVRVNVVSGGGGSGGGDGYVDESVLDLNAAGIPTDGVTPIPAGALEAQIALAREAIDDHSGRKLIGYGVGILPTISGVLDTIEFRNAAADLSRLRLQAPAGASGTMIRSGRSNPGGTITNLSLAIPNEQTLFAVGASRSAEKNSAVTCFELVDDIAPGAVYTYIGGRAGTFLRIRGNVETKRITARASFVDSVVEMEQTSTGSPDSIEVSLVARQFTQLITSLYGAFGNDTSVLYTGTAEGHVAKVGDADVVADENGKASTFDMVCRTYNGQSIGSYVRVNQAANDYTDTFRFGGNARFIGMNGRVVKIESCRRLHGTLHIRECNDGRLWTGSLANGTRVPVEPVFIGRVIDAGGFSINATGILNTKGVRYGDDTYYSIGCDFGRSQISYGAFKPFNAEYPLTATAIEFYRAINCSFPFSQVHGGIIIRKGIEDCTIRLPAAWARIGYPATIEAGGVWTLIIEGSLTWAEARTIAWLSQVTGEQRVVIESISDRNGVAHVYADGVWTMASAHDVSLLSLQSEESDINIDFRRPGLMAGCRDNGLAYVATGAGAWRGSDASTVTPARTARATTYLARLSTSLSSSHEDVVSRLLWQMSEIGAPDACIGAWWLASGTEEAALKAILPSAASGSWFDLTKSGAPSFTATQGFAMNPDTIDLLLTGYDMAAAAEGAGLNDLLLLVGARRDNPAYTGSDNVFDITALNGKAKLRDRDNAEQVSIGTTSTTAFPPGTTRMPDVVMGGRVSAGYQFCVDKGRVVATGAVSSSGGAGGMPDAIQLGGSRELFCAGIFKASHFFTESGGTVLPIADRAIRLHRAFTEALSAVERI